VKVLYKYIIREATSYFLIALASFTAVLLTIRMLKFATLIVDKGVEFSQIGLVFVAIIPTFLEIAIPLSALLGVMLAFARLSGDSEIVVMRASGISLYQLLIPTFIFGILILCLAFSVSLFLKPKGYKLLSDTLFDIARTKTTSGLEDGVFNRLNVITLYADKIDDSSGQITHVMLDDRRDSLSRRIVFASSGQIQSDLVNKTISISLNDGEIHERIAGKYTKTDFATNTLQLSASELLNPGANESSMSANALSISQLREAVAYFRQLVAITANKDSVEVNQLPQPLPSWLNPESFTKKEANRRLDRAEIELGSRYSLPFASLLLALLALPLGIHPSRAQQTWGLGISAITGMGVFVVYYGLFSIGIVLAQSRTMPGYMALWLPNFFALIVTLFFIRRIGSERWQSIADLFSRTKIKSSLPSKVEVGV
jgi:lipopolysaccharide export system permease protein